MLRLKLHHILFFLYLGSLVSSCRNAMPTGKIMVEAPTDGTFEIYRIAQESPMQFISEQIGYFNKEISLSPGSYLILADCSSVTVVIQPNTSKKLTAHKVDFITPSQVLDNDLFSIHCNRFAITRSRQHFTKKYSLNILHGKRELLVGMVPLSVDFESMENPRKPKILTYKLSAIQVAAYKGMDHKTIFFVSPMGGLISITEPQEFGRWQYLLPGRYLVEVNGTRLPVQLAESAMLKIDPAFLKVSVGNKVDLNLSSQIRGTPLFVELNENHWLDLNQVYPVLPGEASIRLNGSNKPYKIKLEPGILTEKQAKSVTVHYDCAPWEWTCLGARKIFLYEKEKSYAFTEGVTDVPILFFEEDSYLSIQGSRDIRYQLPLEKRDNSLYIGKIKLIPRHLSRPGQISDLTRIEAIAKPFEGHTLDIPLEREITLPLIVGSYHLAHYVSSTTIDGERRSSKQTIHIKKNQQIELKYNVFLPEKKIRALEKSKKARIAQQAKRKNDSSRKKYRQPIAIDYF